MAATPRPITPDEYRALLAHLFSRYPESEYLHHAHGLSRYLPCVYEFTIPAYGYEVKLSVTLGSDAPLNRAGTSASLYCGDRDAVHFLPLTTRTSTTELLSLIDAGLRSITNA